MRAYYHYLLFEQYGPIPLVKDAIYERDDDLDIPRSPIDEIIAYIDQELKEVSNELSQEALHEDDQHNAWATKGVALAVRAKLWKMKRTLHKHCMIYFKLTIEKLYGPLLPIPGVVWMEMPLTADVPQEVNKMEWDVRVSLKNW